MTRDELISLLALLVRQRQISLDESRQTLAQFDAGALNPSQLPLPVAEALAQQDNDMRDALIALALLFGGTYGRRFLSGGDIPLFERQRVRDALRAGFEREAALLAARLGASGNVRDWHTGMRTAVGAHILRQYMAGLGRAPRGGEAGSIRGVIREQMAFAYRFAGHVGVRLANELSMSVGQVRARANMYAGAAWEHWHRGAETDDSEAGYVYDYITRDDWRVCGPCIRAGADGPYLSNQGVFPGDVCLGTCRCIRRRRYAPDEWSRLTGRRMAA